MYNVNALLMILQKEKHWFYERNAFDIRKTGLLTEEVCYMHNFNVLKESDNDLSFNDSKWDTPRLST